MNNNVEKPSMNQVLVTIFLGFLGIHKLMNKQYVQFILYLITLGGVGILWIYDAYCTTRQYLNNRSQQTNELPIESVVEEINETHTTQQDVIEEPTQENTTTVEEVEQTTEAESSQQKEQVEEQPTQEPTTQEEIVEEVTIEPLTTEQLNELYTEAKTQLFNKNYIVFDVETTGLDPQTDKIIEISAIKYKDHKQVDTFSYLINPEVEISETITSITGITNEELSTQKTAKEIIPEFIKYIEDYQLIAHNASFDFEMLVSECHRNNIELPTNKILDTLTVAKKYFSKNDVENYKLETFKNYFNLDVSSHRALDDCITCSKLYQHCVQLENEKKKPLNEMELQIINIIKDILVKHNLDISLIRANIKSNLLCLSVFNNFLRIKCRGRGTYVLIPNGLDLNSYNIEGFNVEPATKTQNAQCRLVFTDINQLTSLENYILDAYQEAVESKNKYIKNSKRGKDDFEFHLNTGYIIE